MKKRKELKRVKRMIDLDTIGYYLFMSSQEDQKERDDCGNDFNENGEADASAPAQA